VCVPTCHRYFQLVCALTLALTFHYLPTAIVFDHGCDSAIGFQQPAMLGTLEHAVKVKTGRPAGTESELLGPCLVAMFRHI